VLRLSQFAVLSVEEVALLEALCVNEERFAARVDIVAEGDAPRPAVVLTHGLACRYRILRNGRFVRRSGDRLVDRFASLVAYAIPGTTRPPSKSTKRSSWTGAPVADDASHWNQSG
jgi:hypothetical protein